LRKIILNQTLVIKLGDAGGQVFEDATVDTTIFVLERATLTSLVQEHYFEVQKIPEEENVPTLLPQKEFLDGQPISLSASGFGQQILVKMESISTKLDKLFYCTVGVNTGYIRDVLISDKKIDQRYHKTISGSDIDKYSSSWSGEWICYDKELVKSYGNKGRSLPPNFIFNQPKILLQRTRNLSLEQRLIAYFDTEGYYNLNRLSNIVPYEGQRNQNIQLTYVCGLLNANLLNWYFSQRFVDYEIKPVYLRQLPIRRIAFTTPSEEREQLRAKGQALYEQFCQKDDYACVLGFVEHHLPKLSDGAPDTANEKSDVIQDLLAFLAERMIESNKQKQAEAKQFITWIEAETGSQVEDWGNKTDVQEFWTREWAQIERTLQKNRGRLMQTQGLRGKAADAAMEPLVRAVRAQWEESRVRLQPVLHTIAHTDRLINQIVYRLYGLMDDEIAIVEGR